MKVVHAVNILAMDSEALHGKQRITFGHYIFLATGRMKLQLVSLPLRASSADSSERPDQVERGRG